MSSVMMGNLRERLESVQNRIGQAAERSGRSAKDIALVVVTKGVTPEALSEAHAAGILIFGENRVQEAEVKIPLANLSDAQWHMIGHLQTNKVSKALSLFSLIQSVDSVRLARDINDESTAQNKITSMLLEVNISGESKKYGFSPEAIYTAIDEIAEMPALRILGLMGLGPLDPDPEVKRQAFKKLRSIFSVCKSIKKPNLEMKVLSMGMSDDFEIAIEEGSNMVRLGRALFK